jgi:hypothetical protein
MLKRIPSNQRDCWKTNARGSSSTSRLLFQALPSLVKSYGEPLHHRGYQLVCVFERAARNQSVACSTVIGNLPISDSENEGMGSKIAAPRSRASASWPFTNLGPSGCFGGIPIARQFGRRKLLIVCLRSAITPPLSFQQSLAPASIPHIVSGNESLPFADLPCLLRLSQPAAQSHAQTGSLSTTRGWSTEMSAAR